MRTYTQPLSRELDHAVYLSERHPRFLLWRMWRRAVDFWRQAVFETQSGMVDVFDKT